MKTILFLLGIFCLSLLAIETVQVEKENLITHVKTISTQQPRPTYPNPEGLDSTASYIRSHLESYGYDVIDAPYSLVVEGHSKPLPERVVEEYRNLFCRVGPKDSALIIIGAHYDVYDTLPGADDNASGVAGVLEMARILKQYESTLKRQIELVFFTLEEPPIFSTESMGSAVHANYHKVKGNRIELMMSIEMIGYFSEEKIQTYPLKALDFLYPSTGDYIMLVTDWNTRSKGKEIQRQFRRNTILACRVLTAPTRVTGVDFSDHRNFWAHNYPALMVTNTAMYRNFEYHTENDTWDRLDYNRMSEVVRGIVRYVIEYE